jgi:hypothetical protein
LNIDQYSQAQSARISAQSLLDNQRGVFDMAIKPKPEVSANKTDASEHKDNRYVRAFNVLAADNKLPVDQIAKKAEIKERAARAMIDAWNAAINALNARAALAVDPTTLIHDATADTQNGFSRVVRLLATEGDLGVAELAKRANVSEATARRAADAYRSVLAAQPVTQETRNAKASSEPAEEQNARPTRSSATSATSATKEKAA